MDYIEYLKIPYKHLGRDFTGVDCLGLIVLVYKHEFGIELRDYQSYEKTWYLSDARQIIKHYKNFGFEKTDKFQVGNVLLLNECGYPKHLGICLSTPGYFLHTLESGTACHSYASGFYFDKVHSIYTYKEV